MSPSARWSRHVRARLSPRRPYDGIFVQPPEKQHLKMGASESEGGTEKREGRVSAFGRCMPGMHDIMLHLSNLPCILKCLGH